MKDAVGSVQSILVLGAGSDVARATCIELVARRRDRVREFSWEDTARGLAACYRRPADAGARVR
jgi:hypothetical protein